MFDTMFDTMTITDRIRWYASGIEYDWYVSKAIKINQLSNDILALVEKYNAAVCEGDTVNATKYEKELRKKEKKLNSLKKKIGA